MPKAKSNIEIKNKRAGFDYEFLDKYTAGIVLTGTEIKSVRAGKASLVDSYCYFANGELYVKNMHIAEYWWGNLFNHDPRRDRKLEETGRVKSNFDPVFICRGSTVSPKKFRFVE